jgi:hypothetical protein
MKTKAAFYLQLTYVKHMLKVLDSVLRKHCQACQGTHNVHEICAVRYWDDNKEKQRIIDIIYEDLWLEIDVGQVITEWKSLFNYAVKIYPGWYEDVRDLIVYMM